MKIIFLHEQNEGGGAKSSLNLAIAASAYARVTFYGIGFNDSANAAVNFLHTKAKKPLSIKYILDLLNSLKKSEAEIVHANGMFTALLALFFRPFLKRPYKIILTLRHTSLEFRNGIFARLFIPMLNKVDIVHYLTQYQKDVYVNSGLTPGVYKIIPNIIYTINYPSNDINNLRNELLHVTLSEKLIVFAGRITESKQLELFINTINKINLSGYNVAGIILGSGEKAYVEKLKDLTSKLNISAKIVFAGFSLKPELYIKAGDFCLFPTKWNEALPRFIIESFSQKRTLVVSNHPSIGGIITDNYDSLVVKNHGVEEYAEKCIALIKNPDLLKQLESGAERTYTEHYLPEKTIKEYADLYDYCLNSAKR